MKKVNWGLTIGILLFILFWGVVSQAETTHWSWPVGHGAYDSFVLTTTDSEGAVNTYDFMPADIIVDGEDCRIPQPNDLTPGETYSAVLHAVLNGVEGDPSSPPFVYTKPLDVPGDPSFLNGVFSWSPPDGFYDGYRVYLTINGVESTIDVDRVATSANISIPPGSVYSMQVVSYKGSVESDPSEAITGTVKPGTPGNVSFTPDDE